jgi:hypothetical protein
VPSSPTPRRDGPARPRLTVWLVLFLVTHAGSAMGARRDADEPDAERKAAAGVHLKRGAELINAENLAGALAEFELAYELVPSPSILHNFGIVYQGLGRKAEALVAFERFLAEASRPQPGLREHALEAVQRLREQVAELWVETHQGGAGIFVDGRKVGQTPQEKPIYLDPGAHRLVVEKADVGIIHAERIEVRAGQLVKLPAGIERPPVPAPAAAVSRPTAPSEPSEPSEPPRRGWQRPAAWAAGAGAVLATGLLGVELVLRHRDITRFNDNNCGTADPNDGPEGCSYLLASARSAETRALVSGLAAGVLGLGAAVLFWNLPERRGRVALSLVTSPSHLGLTLHGGF